MNYDKTLDQYLEQMKRDEDNANAEAAEALEAMKTLAKIGHEHSHFLHDILEAVRALKPAPKTELGYVLPDGWTSAAKVVADFEQLRKKLECIRVQSEARGENLRRAQDEVEQLRAENAAIRKSISDGDYGPTAAELQRFREREAHVLWLIEFAAPYVSTNGVRARFAAVRDFKVST